MMFFDKRLEWFQDFYVSTEHRSKGIGREFFGYIEAHSEQLNLQSISGSLKSDNTKGTEFWLSVGFFISDDTLFGLTITKKIGV